MKSYTHLSTLSIRSGARCKRFELHKLWYFRTRVRKKKPFGCLTDGRRSNFAPNSNGAVYKKNRTKEVEIRTQKLLHMHVHLFWRMRTMYSVHFILFRPALLSESKQQRADNRGSILKYARFILIEAMEGVKLLNCFPLWIVELSFHRSRFRVKYAFVYTVSRMCSKLREHSIHKVLEKNVKTRTAAR